MLMKVCDLLFPIRIMPIILVLCIAAFQQAPDRSGDDELGICSYNENGCEYFVVHFNDGTGDGYINCGGGAVYYGTGTYGTCSGFYESSN